jgi:hypothetical protein
VRSLRVLNYFYLVLFYNDRRIKNEGIAVVSFPRVGNTYAGRVIKRGGNNRKLKFVHHYHSAAEAINSSNVLKAYAPSKEKEVFKNKYEVESNPLIIIANYLNQKLLKKTNG